MSSSPAADLDTLERGLDALGTVAVAVSGGIDSMTLAVVAHGRLGDRAEMFHAVSPAVPPEATERVRAYAAGHGWRLQVVDAGELEDPDYLRNPRDRCYHCKTHLYDAIAARTPATIVAGTNTDDLDDDRPGLRAAAEHRVAHPFLDAGMAKADVRALARHLGLDDLAELPAAPCLASRIETGLVIRPRQLSLVHRIEQEVTRSLAPAVVRCRIRAAGVVIELDGACLARLTSVGRFLIEARVHALLLQAGQPQPVSVARYVTGSAVVAT